MIVYDSVTMVTVLTVLGMAAIFGSAVATAAPAPLFHDVTLASGVRLRYAEQGHPAGPVAIMLHGFSDSSFSFSRVMPLLPPSMRVIVPDQRGHGGSDRPGGYSMDACAADILGLMDALKIEQATIVGHSMGSFVARRLAVMVPSRITRLVLVGAGANPRNTAMTGLRREVEDLRDPVDHGFVRDFQISTVHRPVPPEFMAYVIRESEGVPAAVWKGALAGLMDYQSVEAHITVPTTILGGDRDSVFSLEEQQELARMIPAAALHTFPGSGHAPHWEDPAAFARKLLDLFGHFPDL